jgi:hypothetical protein
MTNEDLLIHSLAIAYFAMILLGAILTAVINIQ